MERFWHFFIRKRQFSYLLVIGALIFGIMAVVTIPKESAPEVRVPVGIVTIVFPGGSAVDVERLITNQLEDRLSGGLDDVKKISSVSSESVSSVVVEFTAEADLDKSIQSLRDEVDKVKPDLPEDANDPVVSEVNFADQPVLTLAIGGNLPQEELQRIGKMIEDEITSIPGVSRVGVGGGRDKEVRVIAREEALNAFGLSLGALENALRSNNTALPAGSIEIDGIEYTVQFEGSLTHPEEIEGIAITERNGTPIYVRDVADVVVGFFKARILSRVSIDGAPSQSALTFDVFKRSGGNIAAVTESVRERLDELQEEGEPLENLEVLAVYDAGEYLTRDLSNLTRTGGQTIALVMLVLLASIGWRESLLAGIAIPFSFLIGFIALDASGNTINFISLFSLILAVGILVDSAIVMVEGIHTNMRTWMDKQAAAEKAIHDYHWPISAGTLTTVAMFAPLFLISGITGEFIASIPFTIIFVLLASLFVALGIVPLFASFILRRRIMSRLEERQEHYTRKLQAWYKEKLTAVLGNRKRERLFMASIVGAFVIALLLPITGIVKTEFFPQEDIDFIIVELEEKEGTVLAHTDLEIRRVEEILYGNPEISSFVTTVGKTSDFTGAGSSSGDHFASIFINLKLDREKTSTQVVSEIRAETDKIRTSRVTVSEPNNGPPTGAPVLVRIQGGDNLAELDKAARQVEQILAAIPGTANVKTSVGNYGTEFVLTIDRGKAAAVGISPFDVAFTLRTAVQGSEATTIKTGSGEDVEVVVTANLNPAYTDPHETNQVTIDALKRLEIPTSRGTTVLLGSIVETSIRQSRPSISHENGERLVTVSSDVAEGGNVGVISRNLSKQLDTLSFPEGVTATIGGESDDAQQAFQDMFMALIFGVLLMLAILVLQFNSYRYGLYVLSVLPFSLIGVFFGLLITGNAVSFTSLMGFIALVGIIVNNSIILISVINRLRKDAPERPIYDTVIEGCASRLRPILLTTVTTMIGLIPLSFVSELWSPLAIAIIFGLLASATITLFLVPIIYNRWPGTVR